MMFKLYKQYDQMKNETTRFLVFFIPAATLITTGYLAPYPFNGIAIGLLLFAGVTRALYIHKG